jgi:hypothetical protein
MQTRPSGYTAKRNSIIQLHLLTKAISQMIKTYDAQTRYDTSISDTIHIRYDYMLLLQYVSSMIQSTFYESIHQREKPTIGMPYIWGEFHWWWTVRVVGRKAHNGIEKSSLTTGNLKNYKQISWVIMITESKQNKNY